MANDLAQESENLMGQHAIARSIRKSAAYQDLDASVTAMIDEVERLRESALISNRIMVTMAEEIVTLRARLREYQDYADVESYGGSE